jgi:xanthine/CO dehydrogenase XdhC/CoxF family maturation factor
MARMKDVVKAVRAWDAAGLKSAEAILVGTQHSSPRQPGARLAVNEKGVAAGAVSMGCVESDLREHLPGLLRGEGAARMIHYGAAFAAALEVGRMAEVNGRLYLDGGIADPIPFRQAVADGFARRVVILARNRGFRKPAPCAASRAAIRLKYRRSPALAQAVMVQHETYNRAMDEVDEEEQAGRMFVIRPTLPLAVERYSQDRAQLERLYQNGFSDAAAGAE